MIKKLTCIECPQSCALSVDIENCKVIKVAGNKCPKGLGYAIAETENPVRIFTSTVLAGGLSMKMVPVRTDLPIPKADTLRAAAEVKNIEINRPVDAGSIIVKDFLGYYKVNLIATRRVGASEPHLPKGERDRVRGRL